MCTLIALLIFLVAAGTFIYVVTGTLWTKGGLKKGG
jgi:hypothetical protein